MHLSAPPGSLLLFVSLLQGSSTQRNHGCTPSARATRHNREYKCGQTYEHIAHKYDGEQAAEHCRDGTTAPVCEFGTSTEGDQWKEMNVQIAEQKPVDRVTPKQSLEIPRHYAMLRHMSFSMQPPGPPQVPEIEQERRRAALDIEAAPVQPPPEQELPPSSPLAGEGKAKKKEPKIDKKKVKTIPIKDEHLIPLAELASRLNTQIDERAPLESHGLTSDEAERRLKVNGKNRLSPPKEVPEIVKYLKQYLNFFMLLLEAAGILSFIAYALDTTQFINLYLGIILLVIVFIMCTVAYFQERKSSRLLASFKNLVPQHSIVLRDGIEKKVLSEDLVLGDIVKIRAGDKVPADLRIIFEDGIKVDNSSLTGESEPQERQAVCTDNNPFETHNLAFYCTLVSEGQGAGVVVKTGDDTVIGRIANLASETAGESSTLYKEVRRFAIFIACLALVLGVVILVVGFAVGLPAAQNIVSMIGVIVANVPEGLPATVTLCLGITARRLAKRNVYVKKLESVETLGSTTVIATDKTGTLTMNRMTVAHMWYDQEIFSAERADRLTRGHFDPNDASCRVLLRVAACCNRAEFNQDEDPKTTPLEEREIFGDASESALLRLCEAVRPVHLFREEYEKIFEIPFNSKNKWQLSIHRPTGEIEKVDPRRVLMMKGGAEIVLGYCDKIMVKGEPVPFNDDYRQLFSKSYETLGSMGERVLGFAMLPLDASEYSEAYDAKYSRALMNFPKSNYIFVGFCALIDPHKPTVPAAVEKCRTAGIKVVMVTGDHPITATAIARNVGIITKPTLDQVAKERGVPPSEVPEQDYDAIAVNGQQINGFQQADWDRVLSKSEVVFARTSPEQKLLIVQNCQRRKEVVAVTGDGVNDSPAIKRADIGCAMGIVGSDVAKEAAEMILLDDDFASIVSGVEEGRIIFDNLKKSIGYTLSHLFPELLPFVLNIVIGLPLGLSSILVLVIDLGTEMVPSVSLAYEKGEDNIMFRKPRNMAKDRLVSFKILSYSYLQAGILEAGSGMACYFWTFWILGFPPNMLGFTAGTYFRDGAPDYLVNGVSYTAQQQLDALATVQTVYFLNIVVCQVFNLLVCKTRIASLFTHGMKNKMVNIGIVVEMGIALFVIYVPFCNVFFGTRQLINGLFWLPFLPFAVFLFAYGELRKLAARRNPDGWVARHLIW